MMDHINVPTLAASLALGAKQTDGKISEALNDFSEGITLKGSVDYVKDLPASPATGDEYIVLYSGTSGTNRISQKYVWDGTAWQPNGANLKLYRDADGDLCEED